jgi:hypothetical protein
MFMNRNDDPNYQIDLEFNQMEENYINSVEEKLEYQMNKLKEELEK